MKRQEIHWHIVEGGKHYDKRGRPRTRKLDEEGSANKPKRKYAKKGKYSSSKRSSAASTPSNPLPTRSAQSLHSIPVASSTAPLIQAPLSSSQQQTHLTTSPHPTQLPLPLLKPVKNGKKSEGTEEGHVLRGVGELGDDGGLGMLINFIRAYKDGIWLMAPLHPSVLQLGNLQRLFHAPASFEKR